MWWVVWSRTLAIRCRPFNGETSMANPASQPDDSGVLVTLMPGVAPQPVCQILQDLEDGLRSTHGGGNDP